MRHKLINPLNYGAGYKLQQYLDFRNLIDFIEPIVVIVRLSALNCPVKESKSILTLSEDKTEITLKAVYLNKLVDGF